ncbi:hypothetical protein Plhal703r1_c11g0058451 [Plasmopara halstedii]
MMSRHFGRLLALTAVPKVSVEPMLFSLLARRMSNNRTSENWGNLGTVLKELRNVSREHRLEGKMPDTKLLKELGYSSLILAIRKKHGGMVKIASKMGTHKEKEIVEVHKKVSARAKRRHKRLERLKMHDFY